MSRGAGRAGPVRGGRVYARTLAFLTRPEPFVDRHRTVKFEENGEAAAPRNGEGRKRRLAMHTSSTHKAKPEKKSELKRRIY